MLRDSIDALLNRDTAKAQAVLDSDDEVDDLYDQVYRELLLFMIKDPQTIERATYLLWVAHDLERIADRATNIAEQVPLPGGRTGHRCPRRSPPPPPPRAGDFLRPLTPLPGVSPETPGVPSSGAPSISAPPLLPIGVLVPHPSPHFRHSARDVQRRTFWRIINMPIDNIRTI